jgi:hypothetical protein
MLKPTSNACRGMAHVSMKGVKPYRPDRLKSCSVISVVQATPFARFRSECSITRNRSKCGRLPGQAIRLSGSDKAGRHSFHR